MVQQFLQRFAIKWMMSHYVEVIPANTNNNNNNNNDTIIQPTKPVNYYWWIGGNKSKEIFGYCLSITRLPLNGSHWLNPFYKIMSHNGEQASMPALNITILQTDSIRHVSYLAGSLNYLFFKLYIVLCMNKGGCTQCIACKKSIANQITSQWHKKKVEWNKRAKLCREFEE